MDVALREGLPSGYVRQWLVDPLASVIPASPLRSRDGEAETLRLGRQVYAAYSASRHGSNLEGQPNWKSRLPSGRLPAPRHARGIPGITTTVFFSISVRRAQPLSLAAAMRATCQAEISQPERRRGD